MKIIRNEYMGMLVGGLVVAAIVLASVSLFDLGSEAKKSEPSTWKGSVVFAAGTDDTGLENVYFMDHDEEYSSENNLSSHDHIIERNGTDVVMTDDGSFTEDLPYYECFDVVVAARVNETDVASLSRDNIKIELTLDFEADGTVEKKENLTGNELIVFDSGPDYLEVNAVWDNDSEGWQLSPDTGVIVEAKLWLYS